MPWAISSGTSTTRSGDRTRWIDKNGNGWTCEYDRKGRKTKETTPPMQFKLQRRGAGHAGPEPRARELASTTMPSAT